MVNNISDVVKVNKVFKNYKDLCEQLDTPILRGNAQNSQIKEWNRYFSFYKQGHKIIIEEVFDTPKPKIDIRSKGNNSIYIKYIETILLHILSKCKDQTLLCTKNYLMVALGITGRKYISKRYRHSLIKSEQYSQEDMDDFNERTYTFLDRILTRALNNLQSRCLLDWDKELHIKVYDDYLEKSITRKATSDERRLYSDMKLAIMGEFGIAENKEGKYDSLRDIYLNHLNDKFYKVLKKRVLDEYEWEETNIYYNLIFTKKNIINAIPRTEKQLEKYIEDNKEELNTEVIKALNDSIENHFSRNIKKFTDGVNNHQWVNISQYKLNNDYVTIQQNLTEELVKL